MQLCVIKVVRTPHTTVAYHSASVVVHAAKVILTVMILKVMRTVGQLCLQLCVLSVVCLLCVDSWSVVPAVVLAVGCVSIVCARNNVHTPVAAANVTTVAHTSLRLRMIVVYFRKS